MGKEKMSASVSFACKPTGLSSRDAVPAKRNTTTKAVLGNVAPTSIQDEICLSPPTQQSVLGVILGGGAGTRLYPLPKKRAKPAVPLGANYRLIDIPVSNCINSNVNKI